jgi:hypothetical protein
MMDDSSPRTEPGGALVAPPRVPTTTTGSLRALGARDPAAGGLEAARSNLRLTFRQLFSSALDTLDAAGDAVAEALGLRTQR